MVTTRIVSRFTDSPPTDEKACRKILGGRLYPAEEVLGVLANAGGQAVSAWTEKCTKDLQKWAIDADDLCELISMAVQTGRFHGAEWCVQKPDGPWAACDAYSLTRREYVTNAHRDMNFEYYVKFAIAKTGKLLLVVSCHMPEDRG
jgi:hypothetical protein